MPPRNKWIRQIRVDDSVSTAARITVKSRLATVPHFLRLASRHSDQTPEHVHQLRVATRRAMAALSMYQELLPKKQTRWFRKRLRRIRKAAGEARDLDVLLLRHADGRGTKHAKFLRRIRKRRREAQRPIVKLEKQLLSAGKYQKQVLRLLKQLDRQSPIWQESLRDWSQVRIAEAIDGFFDAAPMESTPRLKELHRFRIRGKQLRYTMEIFSSVLPPELRASTYPLVTQLQDRLGTLCDHANTCKRLTIWRKEHGSGRKAKYLRKLYAKERRALEDSRREFSEWWTPELAAELKHSFLAATDSNQEKSIRTSRGP